MLKRKAQPHLAALAVRGLVLVPVPVVRAQQAPALAQVLRVQAPPPLVLLPAPPPQALPPWLA